MGISPLCGLKFWRGLAAAPLALLLAVGGQTWGVSRAQEGAPALRIVSPAAGETVTTDDIALEVAVDGVAIDCAKAGRPDEDGVGHLHVMVDGMSMAQLVNFSCEETITIPGAGLAPGPHTIVVTLASNTHVAMMESAQQIEIDFQPANPAPLPEAQDLGVPGVELVSPSDGATVPPVFTVEVSPVNFNPTAALEGKPNVPGYGHWHVFVDTDMAMMGMMGDEMGTPEAGMEAGTPEGEMSGEMAMMSIAGMVAMPGASRFELDLSEWGPGQHTIWIEPVQNDHTKFAEFGPVEFTVTVEADATAGEEIALSLVDIAFEPTELGIPADAETAIRLTNAGAAAHNFSIDELDVSVDVAPGSEATATIDAPAGTYEFYCNVPGHKEAGMVGTLTVS